MWTEFRDMYSGGDNKTEWSVIFVELPQDKAEAWFEARFGRNPNWITCNCCGPDYSITVSDAAPDPEEHRNALVVRRDELPADT